MSSSTSNPPESETPFGEAQLGQQINVLRRRVQNASFHGPAPRAIAVMVTTIASRPLATNTRPIRGMLFRGSKVYQRPPRYASNQAAKSIGPQGGGAPMSP